MPNDPEDFNKINPDKKDDFIDSSFGVRFTPGDKTESVADKLKETKENLEKKAAEINAAGGTSRFDASADNFKDNFKDEFDNFEFDSSISAFKPFSTPAQTDTAASTPMPETMKPSKASTEPVFPKDGGTFDKPVLSTKAPEPSKDAIPEFNNIKGKENSANDKFFKSGDGLDFATSEHDKKTSPFVNAEKPEMPKASNIDIPTAEKIPAPASAPAAPAPAKPSSPFSGSAPEQKPAAAEASKAQGYRPYPSQTKTNLFTSPAQATKDAEKAFAEFLDDDFKPSNKGPINPFKSTTPAAKPAAPAAPAKPVEPAKPAAPAAPATPAQPAAPVAPAKPVAPAQSAAPVAPAKPVEPAKPVAPVIPAKPVEPAKATAVTGTVVTAATAATTAAAASKVAEPVKPAAPAAPVAPAKPAEPAKATTANGSVVAPVSVPKTPETVKAPAETAQPQRPAATAPKAEAPAPKAEVHTQRPGASNAKPAAAPQFPSETEAKSKHASQGSHQDKSIQPVTQVKKSKKHVKETKSARDPGLAGLITFLVIIFLAIGILWALDNTSGIRSLFGKKTIETIPTVSTETTAETSKEKPTESETTATTTTEATTTTTEATTTTTEATTTTTEATTTTTEATTTTTEATTTTTEATTVVTVTTAGNDETAETAAGSCVTAINTKITKFKTMDKGFKFTIELYNTSNTTCSLPKSLNYLDMKFFCNSTITEVSSECFNFSAKKDGVTFRGTPKEVTIKGRATYSFTVYVYTKENVTKYGYNTAYFDWKKK